MHFQGIIFRYESQIREEYAPEIVKFDPVTDRDKIDIVEEQVGFLFTNRNFHCN